MVNQGHHIYIHQESKMLHAKRQYYRTSGFEEYSKGFVICGYGGHLGYVTEACYAILLCLAMRIEISQSFQIVDGQTDGRQMMSIL